LVVLFVTVPVIESATAKLENAAIIAAATTTRRRKEGKKLTHQVYVKHSQYPVLLAVT